jgi:hypothetical protein
VQENNQVALEVRPHLLTIVALACKIYALLNLLVLACKILLTPV